jgi:hypothetical protein
MRYKEEQMKTVERSTLVFAIILIGLGVIFLLFNLIPGWHAGNTWPAIFIVLAAGFFIPPFVWPSMKNGLAGLFIPGSIMLVLGIIFFVNVFSNDWVSWAYAWLLIPGSVGLGLALASGYGEWGNVTTWTGIWMLVGSLVLFSFFAMLFGGIVFRMIGPIFLIFVGAWFVVRSVRRTKKE